jgi:hypothetical protein
VTGNVDARKLAEPAKPIIDWEPAPGFLLCKALKREELAALYNRGTAGKLGLPDRVGKVSDSVGAGQVIATGDILPADVIEWLDMLKKLGEPERPHYYTKTKPGDYVAWMPFTDQIIEIDGAKYSLVGYDKIRAGRKGSK